MITLRQQQPGNFCNLPLLKTGPRPLIRGLHLLCALPAGAGAANSGCRNMSTVNMATPGEAERHRPFIHWNCRSTFLVYFVPVRSTRFYTLGSSRKKGPQASLTAFVSSTRFELPAFRTTAQSRLHHAGQRSRLDAIVVHMLQTILCLSTDVKMVSRSEKYSALRTEGIHHQFLRESRVSSRIKAKRSM